MNDWGCRWSVGACAYTREFDAAGVAHGGGGGTPVGSAKLLWCACCCCCWGGGATFLDPALLLLLLSTAMAELCSCAGGGAISWNELWWCCGICCFVSMGDAGSDGRYAREAADGLLERDDLSAMSAARAEARRVSRSMCGASPFEFLSLLRMSLA